MSCRPGRGAEEALCHIGGAGYSLQTSLHRRECPIGRTLPTASVGAEQPRSGLARECPIGRTLELARLVESSFERSADERLRIYEYWWDHERKPGTVSLPVDVEAITDA